MAITPTFIVDMTTMKSLLRLTGTPQPDALAMIDAGVQQAGLYLRRILGLARVVAIQGMAYSENPATLDQLARLKANTAELYLVRINLMRSMPVLFMDNSSNARETWNNEGLTRRVSLRDLEPEIARLQSDVDTLLAELAADDGILQGDVQGGVVNRTQCYSPIPITRSLQGGFDHHDLQFLPVAPACVQGGCF